MTDQVNRLYRCMPPELQMGRPPCCPGKTCGATACTDNAVCEVVREERGRRITPSMVRNATGRPVCNGLRPADTLRALLHFGVRGYTYKSNPSAADVLAHTHKGVVIIGVGYRQYPHRRGITGPGGIAELGGKTDIRFTGAHAVTVWGSRKWTTKPANWTPKDLAFTPGTRVWCRDPDHHVGTTLAYDRISIGQLAAAMTALRTETNWSASFAIWRP